MVDKVIKLMKMKSLTIPNLLFYNYSKLNITEKELILIIYLFNNDNTFNSKKIASELNISVKEVMALISDLINKDLIKIVTIDNKKEQVDLDGLFSKLSFLIVNEKEEKKNIFDLFEHEFGRTLSPMEYQIIIEWQNIFTDELITLGLKEAVYNGVFNLKYIDRILHEWQKKNITCENDIIKDRENYKKKKSNIETFDYDWLNDRENN